MFSAKSFCWILTLSPVNLAQSGLCEHQMDLRRAGVRHDVPRGAGAAGVPLRRAGPVCVLPRGGARHGAVHGVLCAQLLQRRHVVGAEEGDARPSAGGVGRRQPTHRYRNVQKKMVQKDIQ